MPTTRIDPIARRLIEAEGYLELGLPNRALECLRSRDDWSSMKFEASLLKGEALRELGAFREAIGALEAAQRLRPEDWRTALALGWCYKRTYRLAQAIDALERAVRQHPDQPLLRYNLACYWSLAGNPNRAVEELGAALEHGPELLPLIAEEPDFDPIRQHDAFQRLVSDEAPQP